MSLLDDLREAEKKAKGEVDCGLCLAIGLIDDLAEYEAMVHAAAGTIGITTLVELMARHSIVDPVTGRAIGRRTIERHRREEHTP